MIDYSTCTQDDVDDGPMDETNKGFLDYLLSGKFCHENPYNGANNDDSEEVKRYVMWYEGWQAAKERFPDLEPKDD